MRIKSILAASVFIGLLTAGEGVVVSVHASKDVPLTAEPSSPFWKQAKPITTNVDTMGKPVPGFETEIRTRWTKDNLYILFRCPYQELFTKTNPITDQETNKLWNYDVAEAFIGWDKDHPRRYKEFEVSPNSEWVDLDIDRDHPLPEGGVLWNSGFKVKTRIDKDNRVWYGEMQIPWKSIDERQPKAGNDLRINFYRMQGPDRKKIVWQATNSPSFHIPESFGTLRLE